jgi:ribose-phosphate pyrophosphokinase
MGGGNVADWTLLLSRGDDVGALRMTHALIDAGVKSVYASCAHPILSAGASDRFAEGPIQELVCTDSVPVPREKRNGKVKVVSIAPLLGEAIHRIHSGLSVGAMFDD